MWLVGWVSLTGALWVTATAAEQPPCEEVHYRWSEKIDTSLADIPPTDVTIGRVLHHWAPLKFTKVNRCAVRVGRERFVYQVKGWVRRIKKHEADGDWHIELTERAADLVTACIIVEIPSPDFGLRYRGARAALEQLTASSDLTGRGDLKPPVELRFIGAAFFDGTHQSPANGVRKATAHGRCNSSVRALWEIHPVYAVEQP